MIAVGNNNVRQAYLNNKLIKSIYLGENRLYTGNFYDEEVEYIESVNADAYIDTGFMPNNKTRIVMNYHGEDSTTEAVYVFGVGVRDTSNLFSLKVTTSGVKYTLDWAATSTGTSVSIGERHVIDLNKNVITIGSASKTVTDVEFQCTSNLRLLSGTNSSGAERFSNGIIYSCQIYDDDVLIRDYIPVRVGNEGALFDKVEGKLYTSAGTGSFSYHSYYDSEIEYLEITENGPYIDTGFFPTYKTRVVADVQTAGVHGFLFGARGTSSSTSPTQFVFGVTGTSGIRTDYFGTTQNASVGSTTVRTVIDKNANVTTAFGVTATNTAVSSGFVSYPMYIFNFNNAGTPASSYGLMKLYSFKIYNNDGSLARDYIPVRVGSEGALYDKVYKELYYNSGTGAFVLGPDK